MIRKILDWLSWPGRKIHELLCLLDSMSLIKYEEAVGRIRQLQEQIADLSHRHQSLQAGYATLNKLLDKQEETVRFLEKARDDACEIKHKAWKYAEDRAAILEGKLGYIKDIIDNGPLYTELTEIDTPPPPKDSLVEAIENSVADMPDDLPFTDYFNEIFAKEKPFEVTKPFPPYIHEQEVIDLKKSILKMTPGLPEEAYRALFAGAEIQPYFDRAGAIRELVDKGYVEQTLVGMTDEQLKKLL